MEGLNAEERGVLQSLRDSGLHLKTGWIREVRPSRRVGCNSPIGVDG